MPGFGSLAARAMQFSQFDRGELRHTSGLLPPEIARQTKLLLDFLQDAFSGEPRRARQNPGGRMLRLVEQVVLDDQDGPISPRFGPRTRIEIGKV
jgi:hypothetical protein